MRSYFPLTACLILVALTAAPVSTHVAAVPPPATPGSELASLVDRYNVDRGALSRRYDVDYSPERSQRFTKFYKDWQQDLARVKFDTLSAEGRIDYTLMRARLEYELRLLAREQQWVSEAASLVPFSPAITRLLEARGRLDTMDAAKAATTLDRLSRDVEAATKAPDAAAKPGAIATVADPARARQINAYRAAEVLSSLRDDLEGEDEPIIGNPIGKAALVEGLASEFIPYSPEDLLAIAEREFAWCDREMLKASREMGFGDDWRAALEKVKTLHAEPGKQTDLVRDQAREAVEYVTKRDLVTVPPLADETWRMTMMSPERQKVNPFFPCPPKRAARRWMTQMNTATD